MSTSAAPNDAHLADRLPADAYHHLIRTLRLTLPPPPTDSAEDLRRRDHAAIAQVAGLAPANAAEANLAAQSVAASEQWKDCLRLAQLPETTPQWAAKCRAQAMGMMRQANSALQLLLRLQAAREKRDADHPARDRAAWTEHCAVSLMAEALLPRPHPDPLPQGEGALCLLPLPRGEGRGEGGDAARAVVPQAPTPQPQPMQQPVAEPEHDRLAEAEHYARIYPERAKLIRAVGRVPEYAMFSPPDDDLLQALIGAHTPALAALDREFAQACPVPRPGARAA